MLLTPSSEESEVRLFKFISCLWLYRSLLWSIKLTLCAFHEFGCRSLHITSLFTCFLQKCQISVWDIRDVSKRVAVVKQKNKERVGAGSVAERGMLFTLLLQSPYSAPQGDDKGDDPPPPANSYSGDLIEKSESDFCLSSSVPRLLAGYEDGSVCCFDIRTFRW